MGHSVGCEFLGSNNTSIIKVSNRFKACFFKAFFIKRNIFHGSELDESLCFAWIIPNMIPKSISSWLRLLILDIFALPYKVDKGRNNIIYLISLF